jgi:hypothetical protein
VNTEHLPDHLPRKDNPVLVILELTQLQSCVHCNEINELIWDVEWRHIQQSLKALFSSITVLFAGDISRAIVLNRFTAKRSFDNHESA